MLVNYDFFCWKEGMTWNGIRFCYLSLLAYVFAGVLRELSEKKNLKNIYESRIFSYYLVLYFKQGLENFF
jgi:hypothetical protein